MRAARLAGGGGGRGGKGGGVRGLAHCQMGCSIGSVPRFLANFKCGGHHIPVLSLFLLSFLIISSATLATWAKRSLPPKTASLSNGITKSLNAQLALKRGDRPSRARSSSSSSRSLRRARLLRTERWLVSTVQRERPALTLWPSEEKETSSKCGVCRRSATASR